MKETWDAGMCGVAVYEAARLLYVAFADALGVQPSEGLTVVTGFCVAVYLAAFLFIPTAADRAAAERESASPTPDP